LAEHESNVIVTYSMSDDYQHLMDLVAKLGAENRRCRSVAMESALIELRFRAAKLVRESSAGDFCLGQYPPARHFGHERGLPDISRGELTSEVLAEAILGHAGLVVRGFFDADTVGKLVAQIREEQSLENTESPSSSPEIGCSPSAMYQLISAYEECGFLECVSEYFGEPALMHAERAKLRRRVKGRDNYAVIPWHQDVNFFLHKSFALNVWCALNPVGQDNPGLAIVPRRTEQRLFWRGEGVAPLDYGNSFSSEELQDFCVDHPVQYPVLDPGDAVIFDEMTLHSTASRPWRLAEQLVAISWFFRASRFPGKGTPVAV